MATQRNPFSLGLEQWAASMDPADIARGNSLAMSQKKTGLESQILADRIKHRGLFSQSAGAEGVNPTLIYGELTGDSVDAAKALRADRERRVFDATTRGDGTPEQLIRANYAVGNNPNDQTVAALYGQAPEVKAPDLTKNIVDVDGTKYEAVKDENGQTKLVPIPGQVRVPQKVVVPEKGSIMNYDPATGTVSQVARPSPVPLTTSEQVTYQNQLTAAATRAKTTSDSIALRPFNGDKNLFVLNRLGLVDRDGDAIEGRLPLNPIQLQSVMALADDFSAKGFSYSDSVDKSLEKHGIAIGGGNVVAREFDGLQFGPWFNPSLDEEEQSARPGTTERLPLPQIGDGRYSTTPDADFYLPDTDLAKLRQEEKRAKAENREVNIGQFLRPNMRRSQWKDAEIIPIRSLAKLTGSEEDVASAISRPTMAVPYETGVTRITNGTFYYKKVGNRTVFGVGGTDAQGEPAIMFEE